MTLLSLREAALAVGKDPSTITRAVRKGVLSAERDQRTNNRQFDPAELIRVFGPLKNPDEPAPILTEAQMQALTQRIDELQHTAAAREQERIREVADARAERDRWAKEAEDWKVMAQQASERIPQLLLEYKRTEEDAPPDARTLSSEKPKKSGFFGWFD